MEPTFFLATRGEGLFCVTGDTVERELANESIRSLAADGRGGLLAIVGKHSLCRRSAAREWTELAKSDLELSCCVASENVVFVGTADARMLRIEANGAQHRLTAFDAVAGRDTWYAGTALIDGNIVGPPLGVRSLTATCDGTALLANVHVGGMPRSPDGGLSWQPTIDIESDVHEVSAHSDRPQIVVAAAGAGLCISRDAGATWTIEFQGLHAPHCSAVACGRTDIFVSASTDPFATQGAVYRRPIHGNAPLQPVGGGLPRWLDGIADTECVATKGSTVAVIDQSGRLYISRDDGTSWSAPCDRIPAPSAVLIC